MHAMMSKKIIFISLLLSCSLGQLFGMLGRAGNLKPKISSTKIKSPSSKIKSPSSRGYQKSNFPRSQNFPRKSFSSFQNTKIPGNKVYQTSPSEKNIPSPILSPKSFTTFTALKRYFSPTTYETVPLHTAASNNNIEDVENILQKNPSSINTQDENGNTALHFAVLNKNQEISERLIKEAQKQNKTSIKSKLLKILGRTPTWLIKNKEGKNAFWLAVENGDIDLIVIFLKNGALLQNNKINNLSDPVNLAITDMTKQLAQVSTEQEAKKILSNILVQHQIIQLEEIPQEFVESVSPREGEESVSMTTVANANRNTSLIEAIKEKNIDEIKNELALGVDLLAKNKNGLRPIDYIAMTYSEEIVKEIIKQGYKLPFCKEKSSAHQKSPHTPKLQNQQLSVLPKSFASNQATKNLTRLFSQLIATATAHGAGASALDIEDRMQVFALITTLQGIIDLQSDEYKKLETIDQEIAQEEESLRQSAAQEVINEEELKSMVDQAYNTALKTAMTMALKEALKALCSAMGMEYAAGLGSHLPKIGNILKRPLKGKDDDNPVNSEKNQVEQE